MMPADPTATAPNGDQDRVTDSAARRMGKSQPWWAYPALWPFVRVECWRCAERRWQFNWRRTWSWCSCGSRVLRLRDVSDYRRLHDGT